jgi:hypothetical protein
VKTASTVIGIIDGYFEHRLPVWHKEILWALTQGARVYGAASMGALRAAELTDYGMVGVGRVFEWFRDGVLEDDDEVAVVHEDAEHGFRLGSDALVNIRATVERAVRDGIVTRSIAGQLIAVLKATPYPRRCLRTLLRQDVVDADVALRLSAWLAHGWIDQKRVDALELLARIRLESVDSHHSKPRFAFAHTEAWEACLKDFAEAASDTESSCGVIANVEPEELLEELQVGPPEAFHELWSAACARATRSSHNGSGDCAHEFVLAHLIEELRARGVYERVAQRAGHKSALLAAEQIASLRSSPEELVQTYFESFGGAVPEDLEAYARALAFLDAADFVIALARERWYRRRCSSAQT